MSAIQDAMNAKMDEIQAVVAASSKKAETNGHAPVMIEAQVISVPVTAKTDKVSFGEILKKRTAQRKHYVETRDAKITKLRDREVLLQEREAELRGLYAEKPELEKQLEEEKSGLREAENARSSAGITVYQEGVKEFTQYVADNAAEIAELETDYPELKAKIDEEQRIIEAHRTFLQRFMKEGDGENVRYAAKGTPTPGERTLKDADAFLEASIKNAASIFLLVLTTNDSPALFIAHDGARWNPNYPHAEGAEICRELDLYQKAIQAAWQKKLQKWADEDVAAGLLLPPAEVAQQKKDSGNRYNMVNLMQQGSGFCFVQVVSSKVTELLTYHGVPEMRVECSGNPEGKKYKLRITAVTAPQFVEDFFFPSMGHLRRPTFYVDDLHEVAAWKNINEVIQHSLIQGIRRAESRERRIATVDKLRQSVDKTLCQLADAVQGTAVVCTQRTVNGYGLEFQIVSDGVTVTPGHLATDRSKKSLIYEEILDGRPTHEFFARGKNGLFINEHLREVAFGNETFELDWYVPVAALEYEALPVSQSNVIDAIMPVSQGGRNGTYLFRVSVTEKRGERTYHDVAYVMTRTDDIITFVAGLNHFSSTRFVQQGFVFGAPYGLNELKGYVLHLLQKMYCKEMPYDTLPEHLKSAQAKAQTNPRENGNIF